MKNILWAVGTVIVAVLISLLITLQMVHVQRAGNLGAITSPPTNMDYLVLSQALGFGNTGSSPNANVTGARVGLNTASSTLCAIQNPLAATSSLLSFSFNVATASTTSVSVVVGTTTSASATSSNMTSGTIAANTPSTLTWDPPINGATVGPLAWVTVGTLGGTPTTLGGACTALFISST